ncbi:MAG: dockerin type I domain-containing protein [Ruminococcus sp.]
MKKEMAFLTALVMAALSVPMASVSAASAYVQGDVDKDGLITGRDAAMVSMYADGLLTLTEGQLSLADVNADGTVDAADAALIYENQQYKLGDVDMDGYDEPWDIQYFVYDAAVSYGEKVTVEKYPEWLLADVNCDGVVSSTDSLLALMGHAKHGAGLPRFEEGKYYYTFTLEEICKALDGGPSSEIDFGDAILNVDEISYDLKGAASILQTYSLVGAGYDVNYVQRFYADLNGNGAVDLEDATIVLTAYAKNGAGVD